MTGLTLLIVNYFSFELTREAINSARTTSSSPLRVVVVDNSCDMAEYDRLSSLELDQLVRSDTNRGYSGGVNLGLPHCADGVTIISNPDVIFFRGAVDGIAEAARSQGVAGPKLVWDADGTWILPPADEPRLRTQLSATAERRWQWWQRRGDRKRTALRAHFWNLETTTNVKSLSGAVLAVDTTLLRQLGGFDERFALYFEETDFLRRARHRGVQPTYVPSAVCRHLYNQSAGTTSDAGARYLDSERAYHRKWSPPALAALVERIGAVSRPRPDHFETASLREDFELPSVNPAEWLVEVSPLADFGTAAGFLPTSSRLALPLEIVESLKDPVLYLRFVRRDDWSVARRLKLLARISHTPSSRGGGEWPGCEAHGGFATKS